MDGCAFGRCYRKERELARLYRPSRIAHSPRRPLAVSHLASGAPANQRAAQRADLFVEIGRTSDGARDFIAQ
jgi:hypothetical protein